MLQKSLCIVLLIIAGGCSSMRDPKIPELQTVPSVDLNRYLGVWYEIARYPNSFQKNCVGSRATYSMKEDGNIALLNECYDRTFEGSIRSAKGTAEVIDKASNARLKVSFFWPFYGAYWIIDLGSNYEYAVVGHPERKYLWILSRSRQMDDRLYEEILDRLRKQQYDTVKLLKTAQQ
jgi:apolipoprotein D and lipocalin family protein